MTYNYKAALRDGAFNREPHVFPKLEHILPYSTYAISINPAQEFDSYLEFYRSSESIFSQVFKGHFVDLRPEFSHKNQRWHWHGNITFKSSIQIIVFYKNIQKLKDFCTFAIKPIDSWEWFVYCRKQRPLLKPYIDFNYNRKTTVVKYHFRKTFDL